MEIKYKSYVVFLKTSVFPIGDMNTLSDKLRKHTCFLPEQKKKIIDENFSTLIGYFSPPPKILNCHITYFLDILYPHQYSRSRLEKLLTDLGYYEKNNSGTSVVDEMEIPELEDIFYRETLFMTVLRIWKNEFIS